LLVAAQYIQKTPKINGLLAFWLIDFRPNRVNSRLPAGSGRPLGPWATDCGNEQHNSARPDQQAQQDKGCKSAVEMGLRYRHATKQDRAQAGQQQDNAGKDHEGGQAAGACGRRR
jgi:hypothetical protein